MREVTTHYPFHEESCLYESMFDKDFRYLMVVYDGTGCTSTYNKLDGTVIEGDKDENYYMC